MESNKTSPTYAIVIILIIIIFGFWFYSDNINKQLNAYKEQNNSYQDCVDEYQNHETDLISAITDSQDYLSGGGSDNYISAEDTLDSVDTSEVNCDIPEIKDLLESSSSSD